MTPVKDLNELAKTVQCKPLCVNKMAFYTSTLTSSLALFSLTVLFDVSVSLPESLSSSTAITGWFSCIGSRAGRIPSDGLRLYTR